MADFHFYNIVCVYLDTFFLWCVTRPNAAHAQCPALLLKAE